MDDRVDMLSFHRVLAARDRASEIPPEQDLYGFLVGRWDLEVRHFAGVSVAHRHIGGELHAGRVLEGRAIQDVWLMPPRSKRASGVDAANNMYGTTLRLWDPTMAAWRIFWNDPARNQYDQQVGRRSGSDIVQLGVRADGTTTRWMFVDIAPDSFHWLGSALEGDGKSWRLEGEFLATRTG